MALANKGCMLHQKNQFQKHQMGFDGEHVAMNALNKLGYKGIQTTSHKHTFDLLSGRTAFEVKALDPRAIHHQMGVSATQKAKKLAWAVANKKKAKSVMVLMNDFAEVYIKGGVGKFRKGSMTKIARYDDWRLEVGAGRTDRLVESPLRPPP